MERLISLHRSAALPRLGTTTFYEVKAGDSLEIIAERFGLNAHSLALANGLVVATSNTRFDELVPGCQLQVNGF
jgi:LysM domain